MTHHFTELQSDIIFNALTWAIAYDDQLADLQARIKQRKGGSRTLALATPSDPQPEPLEQEKDLCLQLLSELFGASSQDIIDEYQRRV